jgi:hypothetical protein
MEQNKVVPTGFVERPTLSWRTTPRAAKPFDTKYFVSQIIHQSRRATANLQIPKKKSKQQVATRDIAESHEAIDSPKRASIPQQYALPSFADRAITRPISPITTPTKSYSPTTKV